MMNLKENFAFNGILLKNFTDTSIEEKEMVRECRNNESVRKWMYSEEIISQEEHFNFIENLRKDNKNFYWIVYKDEEFIGVISLNNINLKNKNGYLGLYSNPFCELKNKGHLLINCLKKLAFDIIDLHSLKLEVIENNERAVDFYTKTGFKEEGRLKEFVLKDGKWLDVIILGILNR
ncbi:UDP-4-amino-4,6-dideoxy-N-acetyl-beta-L-altrosamine N-acetyltransferase [Methanosarcina sp. Ant1]|nr:UDP-4-amino-4,6-dideoxy-N-acetyl-beta-L-altrosamine N-acetyltransferase [Methanosarcina sp. Ant1]